VSHRWCAKRMADVHSALRRGLHLRHDRSEFAPTLPYLLEQLSPGRRHPVKAGKPAEPGARTARALTGWSGSGSLVRKQATSFPAGACRAHCHGCEGSARTKPRSRGVGGTLHVEPKTRTKRRAGAWTIEFVSVSQKAPSSRFTRRPLNLNSHNHNQRDRRRRFYLAIQIGRESSIVFAIVVVFFFYSNPFCRSLQYATPHRSRVLMPGVLFRTPIVRRSISQRLSNCYAPAGISALAQRRG